MSVFIRNFAIIAHVDHGKSTLADRLLELTGVVKAGGHEEQMLDRNPISRERGITIKLAPVRMRFEVGDEKIDNEVRNKNNSISHFDHPVSHLTNHTSTNYILNLIDTPGHVDFSYEVDRTLACVEGVVLLVDATQGIQAQTISNAYKAIEKNLVIIPVINKIDLPNAEVEKTRKQLSDFLGILEEEVFLISAKTGLGVQELLEEIIKKILSPRLPRSLSLPRNDSLLHALIFDSYYDTHRGVISFVRIFEGEAKKGQKVKLAAGNVYFEIQEVGYFLPDLMVNSSLKTNEIGYIVTNLKDIHEVQIGDSIVLEKDPSKPLSGYKVVKPMVFASFFTTDTKDYLNLKKALEKLYLNDSSLSFSAIHSKALGAGFRVGFLGLLHADVVRERLEREFNLDLVLTPPQVEFKKENNMFYEPQIKILIVTPQSYVGAVMTLCENYRAKFVTMDNKSQVSMTYEMPMSEMISGFHDNLKTVTSGYASFDWEFLRYEKVEADQLIVMLNGDEVAEFSEVVVRNRAMERGRILCQKLHGIIPRQQFDVKIQAKFKGKIIASERLAPFRKNVLVKSGKVLGAGDVGRKKKLLERQKEGKKKMKMIGKVEIPKEAFLKLFKKN